MERLANMVHPIMAKRKWRVGSMREFFPKSAGLQGLNQNRGQVVRIRLRRPRSPDAFMPWEHCLGTTLHELVHNEIGPHNKKFYAMLEELWGEAEALMDKGWHGFDKPGSAFANGLGLGGGAGGSAGTDGGGGGGGGGFGSAGKGARMRDCAGNGDKPLSREGRRRAATAAATVRVVL